MRVLVAGGGSGGHLYPALAILEGFRAGGAERLGYIGARRELERHVLTNYQWIEHYLIHGRGLPRRPGLAGLLALLECALSLIESLFIILKFRPTVLIGTGGFASFAPILWGIVFRIPTAILEVNVTPGLVNRLLAPHVDLVATAYPQTASLFRRAKRVVVTGVPLRPELLEAAARPKEELKARLGLDPRKRTVLVLGGSRGAAPLNRAVLKSKNHQGDLQVLLITGPGPGPGVMAPSLRSERLLMREYLDRIGEALGAADLVVSRAGAATLAELTALGKPAVLIPWPGAAEDHQAQNARFLAQAGGALLLPEEALVRVDLLELVGKLLREERQLREMAAKSFALGRRDGLERFVEEVRRLTRSTLSASAARG
ncbi:MAG: UDP-N-acetylglucosamine--N-acetylmuramyl-(pentapeptide) pyrophosphoryl-undecaprenol N-acetylglucosamine transferase [Candidatus Bipolaricaulia bacterium]